MRKSKFFFSLFAFSFIWTVGFAIFSLFSLSKAQEMDPDILAKVSQKAGGSNLHLQFNQRPFGEPRNYNQTEDSWTLPVTDPQLIMDISLIGADIEILSDPSAKEISIKAQGRLDPQVSPRLLKTEMKANHLEITEPDLEATQNLHVQIKIPASYQGHLKLRTVQGPVRLKKARFQTANLETISGSVQLEFSKIQKLELKTVSGLCVIDNFASQGTIVKSISGDLILKIEDPRAVILHAETVSGQLINPPFSNTDRSSQSKNQGANEGEDQKKNNKPEIFASTVSGNIEIK